MERHCRERRGGGEVGIMKGRVTWQIERLMPVRTDWGREWLVSLISQVDFF